MKKLALVVVIAACAPAIVPIAYTPQPARIQNPPGELKTLLEANPGAGCVIHVDVTADMLAVKSVCSRGTGSIGTDTVRFDRVKSVELRQQGEWYTVVVQDNAGETVFDWGVKSLDDAQHIEDAIVALSSPGTRSAPAPGTASHEAGEHQL